MIITIVIVNPQTGKRAGVWMTLCAKEMVLRIWGFWKNVCWDWTIEVRVGFWSLKDIVAFFGSLPTEVSSITRCAACWYGVSIVWLSKTFKNCISLFVSRELKPEVNKPVLIWNNRVPLCFVFVGVLYYCCDWSHHGKQHLKKSLST